LRGLHPAQTLPAQKLGGNKKVPRIHHFMFRGAQVTGLRYVNLFFLLVKHAAPRNSAPNRPVPEKAHPVSPCHPA
jgi:hypothetical protein